MFTRYDKAGAAAIAGAVTTIVGVLIPDIDAEVLAAGGTLLASVLVWAVPNAS